MMMFPKLNMVSSPASPASPASSATVGAPEWYGLGASRTFGASPRAVRLHDSKLLVYRVARTGKLMAAVPECPHRGGSLERQARQAGLDGLRCSYHGRCVTPGNAPELFLPVAERDGFAWVNCGDAAEWHQPPACPEHSDPAFRTIDCGPKILEGVNPVLLQENVGGDYKHLEYVHAVHPFGTEPTVVLRGTDGPHGLHGAADYVYTGEGFTLVVENEFWAPFTASLRFNYCTDDGKAMPPLVLWFTLRPVLDSSKRPGRGSTVLHVRVSRAVLTWLPWLTDRLFEALNELPLLEDADVVRQTNPLSYSANRLVSPQDDFLAQYRGVMLAHFSAVLAKYVR